MDAKTTIKDMLATNQIFVPNYQRAYSWEKDKQVNQFFIDIKDHIERKSNLRYYFGHFIFETRDKDKNEYNIIDGQQRLTTIEIFLSAIFSVMEKKNIKLDEDYNRIKEDTIKRGSYYKFSTVGYDNLFFKDYVIDQKKQERDTETQSAKRIADAFDFFVKKLQDKSETDYKNYIDCVIKSDCSTHIVNSEAEAISMFIFQNDRGKQPTKLEVIKAKFMYEIQTSNLEAKINNIDELQERFEEIYKSIAKIDNRIDEDDVLLYVLRVYFNDFNIDVSSEKIEQELKKDNKIDFIMKFTFELEIGFKNLEKFFNEKTEYEIYSLALLGKTQVMPFVIKAYKFNILNDNKKRLFKSLESIVLRHRIISTRAHLEDRLSEEFKKFTINNPNVDIIIEKINSLKTNEDLWWSYWNNKNLEQYLTEKFSHGLLPKHILWKYENHLRSQHKQGYSFFRFEDIKEPELEHIAPKTKPSDNPINEGYCEYDDEFINQYLFFWELSIGIKIA